MLTLNIPAYEWHKSEYIVSTERECLDIDWIHFQLSQNSYRARQQSREKTERSIAGALAFGIYQKGQQVGFARVVTDYTRFVWLCDVIIDDSQRGRGLGTWLITCVREHPELANVHRWMLSTDDAQSLYTRLGWQVVSDPGKLMEIPRN